MQKESSSGNGGKQAAASENQSFATSAAHQYLMNAGGFRGMYSPVLSPTQFMEAPLTPSSDDDETPNSIQQRLYLAGFSLQYHETAEKYGICLSQLHETAEENECLRKENTRLRILNGQLAKQLSLLSPVASGRGGHSALSLAEDFARLNAGGRSEPERRMSNEYSDASPTSVLQFRDNRSDRRSGERVTLPKSISIRSSGFLKVNNQSGGSSSNASSSRSNRLKVPSPVNVGNVGSVFVPGGKEEQSALELEVYSQGMFKTELCNKWQLTGACPYGDQCQFAHGIGELRPVIRHPRYKTEVCRMVLAGDICPYGHRCHFRHAVTDQDRSSFESGGA